MQCGPSNIVLIGMPGAGKSTVGVILAKHTARDFIDTDVMIQAAEGRPLQEIVDADGCMALRRIEERVLLSLQARNHVVATGGSAVYSAPAMEHLRRDAAIVFLQVGPETLRERLSDFATRGIARRPDQTFEDLYEERLALYRKYADMTVDCDRLTHEQVSRGICERLRGTDHPAP